MSPGLRDVPALRQNARIISSSLSLDKLAFVRDPLMRFVGVLDAIFRLAVTGKPLGDFENTIGHKPTDCRIDGNDISDLEFVGHRFLAFPGG